MAKVCEEFPIWALVPKKETGVTNFLTKYPQYDGRDTVIAILDSGVDPAADGLSVTSTGKTKVIERFDCSGVGDVDTSTIVKDVDGTIQTLSGRILTIPSTWNNPSKEYHIGLKNLHNFYHDKLRERLDKDYKEKYWDPIQQREIALATKQLQQFDNKHNNGSTLTADEKLEKDDLEARLELLNNFEKKYRYFGGNYDCIVFFDGNVWQTCILETICTDDDLSQVQLVAEYSKTHQYRYLTVEDQLTISVNVYDDGNLLEIVGLCSSHGTHVASIASAYFPDCPERNGVAPGAQIISLTIGDTRLQAMETGTALTRAIIKLMELSKVYAIKVVNMSYGEHAHWSNKGRIGELMNEIVNKYGVVWVSSAGNHGPALFTVNAPPDISQPTIIGVGAYVSPEMMVAEYSLREKLIGTPFTWSSCGPTMDGHNGVTVCAPGAAITSVTKFLLSSVQLLNGTSMSAPHTAGAVSILLSGLKQLNVAYSPYSLKRALENSAQHLNDSEHFAQGYGLLQVDRAFDLLVAHSECHCRDVRIDVLVNGTDKGILLRDYYTTSTSRTTFNISIIPYFLDNCKLITPELKSQFNVRLALTCNNSEYVQYPSYLDLANCARAFKVQIDTSGLQYGVHYTTINGYDVNCVEKGALLRIPVTIIKPYIVVDPIYKPTLEWKQVQFGQTHINSIKRIFVIVPEYATWAVLTLEPVNKEHQATFMIHTVQIQPKQSCRCLESTKMYNITALSDNTNAFRVRAGLILEVTVAKYWANINVGDILLNYSLTFHGVKPNCSQIVMHAADGVHQLQLRTLRNDEILPTITLKYLVHPLRPIDAKISALSSRDILLPERQIYQLVLTYQFHIAAKQTEVTPNCVTISDMLYESEFESQIWFLYDNNKQLIAVGAAYPSKYTTKLEKGDYTLKLQLRHDKKDLLENYLDLPISIGQKLVSSITMDIYSSKSAALIRGKKISAANCPPSQIYPIYINALSNDKTAKIATPGQYLKGTITFAKDELGKKVDTYPFCYFLTDQSKKSNNGVASSGGSSGTNNGNNGKVNDKEKNKYDEYMDALRDLRINWLVKMDGNSDAYKLYDQMKLEHNNYCSIHTAMLQSIDLLDLKHQAPIVPPPTQYSDDQLELFDKVINICDQIINQIDQQQLLEYYGIKNDVRSDAAKIKIEMDRQKSAITEALARKGTILCRRYFMVNEDERNTILTLIKTIWCDIAKYIDLNDSKVIFFSMWYATVLGHYGRLLKYLCKYGEDKSSKDLDLKIISVSDILNWTHYSKHLQRLLPTKFPNNYLKF